MLVRRVDVAIGHVHSVTALAFMQGPVEAQLVVIAETIRDQVCAIEMPISAIEMLCDNIEENSL